MKRTWRYWVGMIVVIIALWNIRNEAVGWAVFGLALAISGVEPDNNLKGRH